METPNMKKESSLELQRMLALRTLSRAKGKSEECATPGASISYLLKPNESAQILNGSASLNPSSIFNISDVIADITPADIMKDVDTSSLQAENLSQSVQEILASSCLKNVQDSVMILEGDNNRLQESGIKDFFSTTLDSKQDNISFQSIKGDVYQRLMQDEEEWQKQFAIIPVRNNNENFDTTNFSGIIPSSSFRKSSKDESVMSLGEYFQGSQHINSILNAKTPTKKKPVPLIDIDTIGDTSNEKLMSTSKNNSILSLSTVAKALNEISVQDSPQTIYNAMMKKINKTDDEVINKILKNTDESVIISGSIGIKNNSDSKAGSASSSTLNSTADFNLTEHFGFEENLEPDLESTHIGDDERKHENNESTRLLCNPTQRQVDLTSWITPDTVKREVRNSLEMNQPAIGKVSKSTEEDSVIMICDDAVSKMQKLDISIKSNEVSFPINCLMSHSLKFLSKSRNGLYVKAKLIGLNINKQPIDLTTCSDYLKFEMSKELIYVEPLQENILQFKVWGFVVAQMSFTIVVEGFTKGDMSKKKCLQHTFCINFYKPSITVSLVQKPQCAIKNLNFGSMPNRSIQTMNLLITKACDNILPLKISIRGHDRQKVYAIVTKDNKNTNEYIVEMKNKLNIGLKFITSCETNKKIKLFEDVLDIGIFINGEYSMLKSLNISGTECYTSILFNRENYPLRLEFGKTGHVSLYNEGFIDLSYKIIIAKDVDDEEECTDDLFSVDKPEFTIKKDEELTLQVTLNKEVLRTSKRFILFRQSFDGPTLCWPVIGKSHSLKNYLKCFISPKQNNKISGRASPNLDVKESSNGRLSPTNLSVVSSFKLPSNKISPAKSSHSSFSSGSALGNRLPIRAMKTHISWPSTKIGKSMSQEVTIKNISEHRVKINITILQHGFSLNYNNETSNCMVMVLHSLEVRTFSVIFSPQRCGIYHTKLEFTDIRKNLRLTLPLVGFGGSSEVGINGVFKLPSGNRFLSLGQFSKVSTMNGSIQLFNKGSVPAFAQVLCDNSKNNFFFSTSEINVTPELMIIPPNAHKTVHIAFTPKKNLLKKYDDEVIELATLTIMSGDDGLRQRARQLYHQHPMHKNDKIWRKLHSLLVKMNDEPFYPELSEINEPMSALYEILAPLEIKEVSVTIENRSNGSSDSSVLCDESIMFQSLCAETISLNDTIMNNWIWEPSIVVLKHVSNNSENVKIINNYDVDQKFEVTAHPLFKVRPMHGQVKPKTAFTIVVEYNGNVLHKSLSTYLQIVTENEILKIPVEVVL